ncbi:mitochondrial cruciform cutting endonuclease 1 [Podospora aff. communis PSN243]|uniref:Mitochondrial cruciform cutting endonuclease 1 n=1 Tax=Podospora aff. communis PSN243 TaxID=3040156 RepID=A0AAV9H674_9PEZI|nr:mitochondrial cruciform cutting endonuclease 1 [Podospora aff. communis PSN243]
MPHKSITRVLPAIENLAVPQLAPAKLLQLQSSRCGLSTTGTKAILKERLEDAILNAKPIPPSARILSIDLGLRNFAFSLFTIPPTSPLINNPKPKPKAKQKPKAPPFIALHTWRHIDLVSTLTSNPTSLPTTEPPSKQPTFTPSTLAPLTTTLILTDLLPLKPTHILIERQRFRSASQATVLEWTLRVNTLESMLYASLTTIKALNPALWDGELIAVPPKRVVRYLEGQGLLEGEQALGVLREVEGEGAPIKAKVTAREQKKRKIKLLEGLLEQGRVEIGSEEAGAMVEVFMEKHGRDGKKGEKGVDWKAGRRGRKKKCECEGEDVLTKKDDLSDCLLQGMAWLQWQRNLADLQRRANWSGEQE